MWPIFLVFVGIVALIVLTTGSASAKETATVDKTTTGLDGLILEIARKFGVPPSWLKAIVKRESNFNPDAINPEKTFTLAGVTYAPNKFAGSEPAGRSELRNWIKAGNDPATLGLNPSIGLAQIRVKIAQKFIPRVTAKQLFDPTTNLTASAGLLKQLTGAGITIDTIDAWNVGQDLKPRNLPYRDYVRTWEKKYRADFGG